MTAAPDAALKIALSVAARWSDSSRALTVASAVVDELHVRGWLHDPRDVHEPKDQRTFGPEQCCPEACNGGGCETCRCCSAGWCVTGADGLPEQADDLAGWIEVAREYNPVVAALAEARAEVERLRTREAAP